MVSLALPHDLLNGLHVPKMYFLGELEFTVLFISTDHLWLILVISRNLSVFLFMVLCASNRVDCFDPSAYL